MHGGVEIVGKCIGGGGCSVVELVSSRVVKSWEKTTMNKTKSKERV